jgi:hypothetical protein
VIAVVDIDIIVVGYPDLIKFGMNNIFFRTKPFCLPTTTVPTLQTLEMHEVAVPLLLFSCMVNTFRK